MPFALPYRMFFLRHGETSWNVEGRLQGQRDIPLNPKGIDQASADGRAVRTYLAAGADETIAELEFWASPLERTRQTMELARKGMAMAPHPYATDDRLKEIAFGRWEGRTWRDIRKSEPATAQARDADRWGYVPPDGESYAMLAERVKPWLASLTSDTLVVSHGGVARVMMVLLGGMDSGDAPMAEIVQGRAILFGDGGFAWI